MIYTFSPSHLSTSLEEFVNKDMLAMLCRLVKWRLAVKIPSQFQFKI